jgi:hypothetical protein
MALKRMAVEELGGCCSRCGYDKCHGALHFHHIDPNQKEFSISRNTSLSWEVIKLEVRKCVLLCANCHSIEHTKRERVVPEELVTGYIQRYKSRKDKATYPSG